MQLNFSPLFASIWSEYMTCTSQMSPSEYYDEYERPYLIWVFIMPCILSWFMKFKIVFFVQNFNFSLDPMMFLAFALKK